MSRGADKLIAPRADRERTRRDPVARIACGVDRPRIGRALAAALATGVVRPRIRRLIFTVLAFGGASCAQIQPPSGGPVDTVPPRVVEAYPESAAVRVPLGDSLALRFSEPVDRQAVEGAFNVSPTVEYRERRWHRDTWILRLSQPLKEKTTYAGILGIGARDRHAIALAKPWAWAFSTGDSLDNGLVTGQVVGQRYPGKGATVWAWAWDPAVPDTASEGPPPDPVRLGQADAQGNYELAFLPRGRALRICALYDRDSDRSFDPGDDRWGCLESPVVVPDTGRVVKGVDLYLAAADEPGTVSGILADSSCLRSNALRALRDARTRRDSLRAWLDGRSAVAPRLPGRTEDEAGGGRRPAGRDSMTEGMIHLTSDDSILVGRELLRLDAVEKAAHADSTYCARPVRVRLLEGDTTLVRESEQAQFSWADVPPGIYHLLGFRDLDGNGRPDPAEPSATLEHSLEVLPLRKLTNLILSLPRHELRSDSLTAPGGGAP